MEQEAKTLTELLAILDTVIPRMDDIAARIVKEHPELLTHNSSKGVGIMLGRVIAIANMDFLFYAFGKPELGYIYTHPQN